MNESSCPLCDFDGDEQAVYRHLQTGHLKSELSRRVLADTENDTDEPAHAVGGPVH